MAELTEQTLRGEARDWVEERPDPSMSLRAGVQGSTCSFPGICWSGPGRR